MKLICTASKVSWFTVGRDYEMDEYGVVKDDSKGNWSNMFWPLEPHKGGYRTEFLEDAEFSVAQDYEPVTAADDAPPSEQVQHEALLAAVMWMADEEGIRDAFDRQLDSIRHRFGLLKNPQSQRAFLLALAYFAEEKSQ